MDQAGPALRALDSAPLLGHMLSLLLQVTDQEALAGDRGSRTLRAEALHALDAVLKTVRGTSWRSAPRPDAGPQHLVCFTQVGSADALAFFLPGVCGGLCKAIRRSTIDAPGVRSAKHHALPLCVCSLVLTPALPALFLHSPGRGPDQARNAAHTTCVTHAARVAMVMGRLTDTGPASTRWLCHSAAASADASVNALRALTTLLCITVSDAACGAALGDAACTDGAYTSDGGFSVHQELQRVFRKQAAADREVFVHESVDLQHTSAGKPGTGTGAELRVERSAAWLQDTATKLNTLLPPLFSFLHRHTRSSVRVAVAAAAADIIGACARTLQSCCGSLIEALLLLAHDPWPEVASCASRTLTQTCIFDQKAPARGGRGRFSLARAHLHDALLVQLNALEASTGRGELEVIAASRKCSGAISLAGPSLFTHTVVMSPMLRQRMCCALARMFTLSPAAARVVSLHESGSVEAVLASPAETCSSETLLPRRHPRLSLLTSDDVRAPVATLTREPLCPR